MKILGTVIAAAAMGLIGLAAAPASAGTNSTTVKQGVAQSGTVADTDMSAQRRRHHHRHYHGPRVYPRHLYPSYGYYRPRPRYYGPRYYAPRPYYGGPAVTFGFGPRYW